MSNCLGTKDDLCVFVPYETAFSSGPQNWKIEHDKIYLQVTRRNLLAPLTVITGFLLGVTVLVFIFLIWHVVPEREAEFKTFMSFFLGGLVLPLVVFGLPVLVQIL